MILLDNADHLSLFQQVLHFDYWLFSKINRQWINPFFDAVLPFLRQSEIWLPFYLFLFFFATLNFSKKGGWWCLTLAMTVIISDLISSSLVKQFIFRLRPCQDPLINQYVRVLVNYCPQSSSFTSSHACNHFSAAMFIFLTLKHTSIWWRLIFLWAFAISYSQVYVGVHYPLDVIGGIILGCCIGYAMQVFFRNKFGTLIMNNKPA